MLNVVAIQGRLVADPELKTTGNGVSITRFTLAVDRDYVSQGQERQCDFIDVIAWRRTAEFICKYFHKGSMMALSGSVQTGQYQDKNGNKRKSVEVQAASVSFCERKSENNNQSYNSSAPQAQPQQNYETNGFEQYDAEDDLPF